MFCKSVGFTISILGKYHPLTWSSTSRVIEVQWSDKFTCASPQVLLHWGSQHVHGSNKATRPRLELVGKAQRSEVQISHSIHQGSIQPVNNEISINISRVQPTVNNEHNHQELLTIAKHRERPLFIKQYESLVPINQQCCWLHS